MKKLLLLSVLMIAGNAFAQEQQEAASSAAPAQRWTYPAAIDESATDPASCAAKWDRFRKSAECFARYRVRSEAFAHCTEYPQPAECPAQQ